MTDTLLLVYASITGITIIIDLVVMVNALVERLKVKMKNHQVLRLVS